MIDVHGGRAHSGSWLVCDEFLSPSDTKLVLEKALADPASYQPSEVMDGPSARLDSSYRRSSVRYHEPTVMSLFRLHLTAYADSICERLCLRPFPVRRLELQLTSTGDGGYYRPHSDNNNERLRSRRITCVYYLHREPKGFQGGELRIFASRTDRTSSSTRQYIDIEPRQNRLVAFPSFLVHEVRPVVTASSRFEDRRLAMNGWLHA